MFEQLTVKKYPASIFTEFPENTFLENIAVDEEGLIYVTSLDEGVIYQLNGAGEKKVFGRTNGKLAGIIYLPDRSFLVNGWDENGIPTLYKLTPPGGIQAVHQPPGAKFLNGMALLGQRLVLICESFAGCLWWYDLEKNTSGLWLSHPLLTKIDMDRFFMPAANGIKVFKGAVYVSNTERNLLLKIPLAGERPGEPEIIAEKANLDDFAFDEEGNLFATTHIYNSVIKITPELEMFVIADEADGLAGSTAVAFGATAGDKDHIYVTTNGGMSLPVEGRVQNGRVVKIRVN